MKAYSLFQFPSSPCSRPQRKERYKYSSIFSKYWLNVPQKPDFHGALGGDQAKELYQLFVSKVQQGYKPERVKDGVFQALMVRLRSRVSGFCVWELTKNRKLH
jgi:hypothetical protein